MVQVHQGVRNSKVISMDYASSSFKALFDSKSSGPHADPVN
jgi:hypothetical protein